MTQTRNILSTLRLVPLCLVFTLAAGEPTTSAQDASKGAEVEAGNTSVESAREALQGHNDYPWYDAERDVVKRIDVQPPSDTTNRRSKWETPTAAPTWPDWVFHLLEAGGWTLLAVAVLLLIYGLFRALGSGDWLASRGGSSDEGDSLLRGDIDRIESLPFQLKLPNADLLGEVRKHYEAGDFNQASIYLYSYHLVCLDRHQLIRLARGKTNRQYLRDLRARRDVAEILRDSMLAFEDAFFGHHLLTRETFERNWNRLDAFHQMLEPVPV